MKKWMKTKHFRILFCCVFFGLLFVGMIFLNRFWSKVEVDCGFSTTCYDSMLEKCTLAKVLISYEDFGISYTFVNEIKGYTEGRCEVNTIIYKVDSLDFAEHIDSAKKIESI